MQLLLYLVLQEKKGKKGKEGENEPSRTPPFSGKAVSTSPSLRTRNSLCCNACDLLLLLSTSALITRKMKMHLRLDSKSLASRVSNVAYAILPTSPPPNSTHSTTGNKLEDDDADSLYYEKKKLQQRKAARHSRSSSLAAIGLGGNSSHSSSRRSCRRISYLTAVATLAGVGLIVVLGIAQHSRSLAPEVQFDHRHRIAVDFETTEVPPDWTCNPYKEPGRLLTDDQDPVCSLSSSCSRSCVLELKPLLSRYSSKMSGSLTTRIVNLQS